MSKEREGQVKRILAKVFNCGASQCMSIYTEKDTLTPEQALIELNQIYQVDSDKIEKALCKHCGKELDAGYQKYHKLCYSCWNENHK